MNILRPQSKKQGNLRKISLVVTITNVVLSVTIGVSSSLIAPCGKRAELVSGVCTNNHRPMTVVDGVLLGVATGLFLTLFFGLFIWALLKILRK